MDSDWGSLSSKGGKFGSGRDCHASGAPTIAMAAALPEIPPMAKDMVVGKCPLVELYTPKSVDKASMETVVSFSTPFAYAIVSRPVEAAPMAPIVE